MIAFVRPRGVGVLLAALVLSAAAVPCLAAPPDSLNALQTALADSLDLNGKVVYVDFWASWCVPCRHSFPWMQALSDKFRNRGLEIIAVGVDQDHRAAVKFLEENRTAFPIVFDSTGRLAKLYELEAMPTSFLYDRSGRLVSTHRGFRPDETDSLEAAIVRLLDKGGAQ